MQLIVRFILTDSKLCAKCSILFQTIAGEYLGVNYMVTSQVTEYNTLSDSFTQPRKMLIASKISIQSALNHYIGESRARLVHDQITIIDVRQNPGDKERKRKL